MNGQLVVVIAIVSCAAAFIARRAWLTVKAARVAKAGCASDCGCEPGVKAKDWAD